MHPAAVAALSVVPIAAAPAPCSRSVRRNGQSGGDVLGEFQEAGFARLTVHGRCLVTAAEELDQICAQRVQHG